MSSESFAAGDRGFLARLRVDPVPALLESDDPSIRMRVRRDVLGADVTAEIESLASHPARERLFSAARPDGSLSGVDPLGGTIDALLRLHDLGGVLCDPRVVKAVEWLLDAIDDCPESDRLQDLLWHARGLRAAVSLGFEDDPRVERGYRSLAGLARADGGWLPASAVLESLGETADPVDVARDPTVPSHIATTCAVTRAFTASPRRMDWPVVRGAAEFLLSAVGRDGSYTGEKSFSWDRWDPARETPSRYAVFTALAHVPYLAEDPRMAALARWILERQGDDGRWEHEDALTVDVLVALRRLSQAARVCG